MGIEIPAGLQWVAYLAGEQWPKGDETAMFQIGDDWNASSQQISDLVPKLQQAQSQTASAVSGQTASAVAEQFQSLLSGDSSVQNLVSSMSSLGSLATQTGTQIQYTKLQILSTLGIAAAEIAYALSSVEWTFGASLAWIPPIEAITITVVRQLVSQLIKRILTAVAETLTKTGLRQLVKDAAVGAAVGAGIGIVQDLAIEAYQIHEGVRSGIDWKQVGEISIGAVVGGALGSVAHGLVSKSIGDPSTIGGKALKGAVTHFSVGAVGNVAGAGATGGGLNAEDIFGGAGGGAVSGGIHGGKEHPEGGAHGEKDTTADNDTSPDTSPDDDDHASIKTLVGPDSAELPNGSNDHFLTNDPGPHSDSASPPDGNTPPAPQEPSTGPSGEPAEGVRSTTPTVSSAASDAPAPQNGNIVSGNDSGAPGNAQQRGEPDHGAGSGQGQGARSVEAAQGNSGDATKSSSSPSEAAPAGQQSSGARSSQSDVANAPRSASASSAGSTPQGRGGAGPSATEGTSRPAQAGQSNQPSAGASAAGRASVSTPAAVARTSDSPAVEPIKQSESASENGGPPTEPSAPDTSTPHNAELSTTSGPTSADSRATEDNMLSDKESGHAAGIEEQDLHPDASESMDDRQAPQQTPSEMFSTGENVSRTSDHAAVRDAEPEADSARRSPAPATSKPDVTDTTQGTSRPAPTEQPHRATASTSASAGEPRPKSEAIARNTENPGMPSATRPTSDSEAGHEQSSTRPPPSQGLLRGFPTDDAVPAERSRSGDDVPVLRLRGGAGEGGRFKHALNEYARRIFGPDKHGNSAELVRGLKDKARPYSVAPDGFGPDPFGFRDPSPTPTRLLGVKLAEVPTSALGGHIHALDMARHADDPPPAESDIWSVSAPTDGRWFPGNPDHRPTDPLPDPLEMPKVFHSIWLGGPVTDGRKTTDLVRRNLEKLSKVAQREGMRVVLWTDVPRTDFDRLGGDAARMLSWARRHSISLLSPNEVFHGDEPMSLAAEYRLENAKGTAAGYTAASDILRLEVLHRFGGIYTDHDNQVRRLGGLRNLLGAPGFALHSRDNGIPNNSALLAARAHPFVKSYLEKIKSNYQRLQSQLHPDVHDFIGNNPKAQHENYVLKPALAIRRRSVTERTGPFNFRNITESLNLDGADVPRIGTDQLNMGSAHTWLSTKPLRFTPDQTPKVLEHAISGLIWDLRNREGDLNLAAVAPLIEGLPDPAAGWEAVVDYLRSEPELREQVRTVTYADLRPKSNVPVIGDRLRIRQIDLPQSVLDTFGLPKHGRVTDLKGTWRRGAFAVDIAPGEWGPAPRASLPDDAEQMFSAPTNDSDSDRESVLHGLAAGDSVTPDHTLLEGQPTSLQEPPTGTGRLAAFPHSHNSIDEIRSWIGDVNNDGDAAVAPSGARLANCAPATMVVFDRLSGTPSFGRAYVGGPTGDGRHIHELTRDELGEATGLHLMLSNPERIAERLTGQGPGAHTVVAIKYRDGEQHSFNAYFDGTQVHALDGQHGTIKTWPPAVDRANNPVAQWFMGTPSDGGRPAATPPKSPLGSLPSDGPREDDLNAGLLGDLLSDSATPLPSAQLDPSLSLDNVTGIPGFHPAQIRTDNVLLYRDDTRSPGEVFGTGFEPLDPTNANLTNFVLGRPGAFVSTTRDADLNHLGPPTEARPRVFRYHIVAPGGIDVNATLPHHQDGHEGEVAFLGGIRRENILGAEEVLEGRPQALRLGAFVRNDHFDPRTPNPHFPADPPRESTDSPDASDDDITPMNTPRARPASLPGGDRAQSGPVRAQHADSNSLQRNDSAVGNIDASALGGRVDDNAISHEAPYELVPGGSHHPAAAGETKLGPPSRLRGGATGTDALFGSLRYHADRVLRSRVDSSDSNELVHNLTAEAERVQGERESGGRPTAVAEDRFGPDPFGLRDPAPTPQLLHDVRLADVSTEELGPYFRSLDLARDDENNGPSHDEIWSEEAPPDGQWWRPEDLPSDSDPLPPLPPLPERLEMPKMVHSIWLGGPVTDGRDVTDEVRRNVEELSRKAQAEGMRVALWTDVGRGEFQKNAGDVAAMRDWARSHNIMLLNTDEVFHGGEPMRLAAEYRLETGKGTAAGYTAASDILRLEILHRFGGLYTDGDNEVYDLAGLRDYLRAPGFAAHGTPPLLNNSALLAARKHPFIARLLDTIADNYQLRQDELQPYNHGLSNWRQQHVDHYVGKMANKRRSVMERTGPSNLEPAKRSLGLDEMLPRIPEDKIQMASAKSWLTDTARQYPADKTPWVLQHAISALIWDLRNRRGDLNLSAVAPLIEGLPDPAAGWEAVVGYIHRVPQLRLQVQSVTYSHITFEDSAMEHVGRDRELDLPQSVRNMLGLPPHGHASDVPGVWRRAAFGTQVRSPHWSYLTVDFASGDRHLPSAGSGMPALVAHLRNLGEQWRDVEVSVEGGGAAVLNNAGMDRATAVRKYLEPLVGKPEIKWNDPTSRGPGSTKAPLPPGTLENRRQVVVWWKAKPSGPAGADFSEDELDPGGRPSGSRGVFADTLRRLWPGGQSGSSRSPGSVPHPEPESDYTAEQFDDPDNQEGFAAIPRSASPLDDIHAWFSDIGDGGDPRSAPRTPPQDVLHGLPPEDPPGEQRDAWSQELAQHAQGDGPSEGKGKQREGAPRSRADAWDRYVEALNADSDMQSDRARHDLANWGIADPDALLPLYRDRLSAAPPATASDASGPTEVQDHLQTGNIAGVEDSMAPPPPDPPQPEPQLPARIGDNLILGGTDVVEEFSSDDEGLKHIEGVVRQLGGDAVWESNREQITALFSDDGLKPKVPGMLRGGHAPTRVVNLAGRTTLTISLRLDGISEQSTLHFKENTNKYEFEHTSDSTNTVGSFSERRTQLYGVVQGNITHPKASDTATAIGTRTHDVALTNQRADRQISGGQTAEPATRFHGKIQAVVTHRLSTSPDEMHSHDLAYRTQVAVPTRDVTDETRDAVGPLPGESSRYFGREQPTGPPRVQYTHALSGSDIVTNFSLLGDDDPEDQRPPVRAPRPQTIAAFVTSEPMQTAFAKAYGNKLGRLAMNETSSWLSVEQLQANLHGMTNKQPLVLNFEGIPGARLEVHAFAEPLDTPAKTRPAEGESEFGGTPPMMRATGTTKETEFHYGTETDTSQVRQDLVTWSAQLPTPGRFRGQGGTDAGEASGGLDGTFTRTQTHNESQTRQLRVRSTLKNPAPGQAWHGQVRLRFEMHTSDSVLPARLGEPFKGAVHETRGRFDVLAEQSETTPTTDYLGKEVWAPPQRIWGTPPPERNSVARSPRWRLGGTPRPANLPETPAIPRGAGKDNTVPLRGLGSLDRVTNLDLSGFHGMLDSMGHKAYGSGWRNARSDVSSWYHLNRVRGSLAAMSQHSPLSRPRSPGRGPKGKDSFTADFEQLTFRRVINTLSSPSAELTEGEAITTDRNRQTSVQGALGGRGGDFDNSTVLGEAIGGINQTVRDGERVRNQQRVAVATKFDQPMAIFEGWVRLDGTMTGPRATVHESGLFPVEIAIPLTELQGSRKHDSSLPPTFTRMIPTGFIDEPRPKPPPDPVDQAPLPRNPFAPKSIEHRGSGSTEAANQISSSDHGPSARRPERLQNISYIVDEHVRGNRDAYQLIESPTTSDLPRPRTIDSVPDRQETVDSTTPLIPPRHGTVDSLPEGPGPQDNRTPRIPVRQGTVESMLDGEGVADRATPFVPRDRGTVEIGSSRQGTADSGPERQSTVDSTTPLLPPRQHTVDSVPDRRATIDAPPVDPPRPPLTDAADGTAPPPPPDPVRPQLDWAAPTVEDGHQPPEHAFQQGWHPSDMLVGVDPASGLLEAIRHDLAPALGSSLDEAIGGLSDQFGPSVLLARLTHESGQEWSHDIAVRGGKVTVKVRPVRGSDPTDFEYVGCSKKFETDLSTESQSSTAYIYGNSLRTVVGGRIQIPVPHGSVSAQLTHTTSVRPQEDISARVDQGLGHLSNVDFPNFTGETEYRVPARMRTTEQHDLFRQPIHFEISYEQHVFGAGLKGVPEAPEPVRLSATFSYPKEPPTAVGPTSAEAVRGQGDSSATPRIKLEVDQAVVKIRPHIDRDLNAPDALPGAGSEKRTANEDLVAAHILDSMTAQGTVVFGDDWPQVRAELADEVRTMTVQRELGDYSRGGTKTIPLKSVPGGEVVLGAHLDSLNVTDSKATTEFYSGGQQSLGAGVSNIKANAWQGYIQAQADILPGHEALNVSAQGRLSGGIGNETVDARTESSVTGNVFRKKVATLTHVGTATIAADMRGSTRPFGVGGDRISRVGTARVDFITRESPTDKQDHPLYVPRDGIIRNDEQGHNGHGFSRDTIVRKITNGADVRAHMLESLKPLQIPNIGRQVNSYLNDTRLASKLGAMTRVKDGEGVEFLRRADLRITARADVQELNFVEIEHEGGNAYVLSDVTRTRLHQPTRTREGGGRVLFGPHWRLPGFQGSLLAGAGISGRQRDAPIVSQATRASANAKFPRSYAVFDGVTRVSLTVNYRGVDHELPPVDVHGPILIPQSETHALIPDRVSPDEVDGPDDALVAKPEPTDVTRDPQPEPLAGPSTEGEVNHPSEPDAPTEPSTQPESTTRPAGLPIAQSADAAVDASASTMPKASLSAPPAHPAAGTRPAGLPIAHTADTGAGLPSRTRGTDDVESRSDESPREDEQALRIAVDEAVTRVEQRQPAGPTDEPVNCVLLLEGLRETFNPGRVRAARMMDESALLDSGTARRLMGDDNWSRTAEERIAPGADWVGIGDWSDAEAAARRAGRGSTVYVLMARPSGEGHAFALRHTEDGRLFWVDPQMPSAQRLLGADDRPASPSEWARRGGDQLESAVSTRILVVDRNGVARPDLVTVQRESGSTARAITDSPNDPRYGKGGFEKEKPRYRVKQLPTNIHPNTKFVTGLVDITTDTSSEGQTILETVSKPAAMVPGESGPLSSDLIDRQREIDELLHDKTRIHNTSAKIKDIFSDSSKYTIKPGAEDIEVFADHEQSDKDAVQYTGGTDADYDWAFLYRLRDSAFNAPANAYLLEGLDFGRQMARKFTASPHSNHGEGPYPGFLVEALHSDTNVAWVRAIATSAYLHNSGVLRWRMHLKTGGKSASGPKNFTPAVSRVAATALIKAAPPEVRRFFAADPNATREFFLQTFLANDRAARERFDQPRLSGSDLDDIRDWRLPNKPGGIPGEGWARYFDNFLLPQPEVPVDQYGAMGVRTRFAELDTSPGENGPGLDLWELRYLDESVVDPDTFENRFNWLRTTLADVHREAEYSRRVEPAKVWRSVREVSKFATPNTTRDGFLSALDDAWNKDQAGDSRQRDPLLKTEQGQPTKNLIDGLNRSVPATWHALISDLTQLHQRMSRFQLDQLGGHPIATSRQLLDRQLRQAVADLKEVVGELKSLAPPWLYTSRSDDRVRLEVFAGQVVQAARQQQGPVHVYVDAGTPKSSSVFARIGGQKEAKKVGEALLLLIRDRLREERIPLDRISLVATSRGSGSLTAQGYTVADDTDRAAVVGWVTVSDAAPAPLPRQLVLPPMASGSDLGDLGMSSYLEGLGGN